MNVKRLPDFFHGECYTFKVVKGDVLLFIGNLNQLFWQISMMFIRLIFIEFTAYDQFCSQKKIKLDQMCHVSN